MKSKTILNIIWVILACITIEGSSKSMIAYEIKYSLKQLPMPISISSSLKKLSNLGQTQITKIEIKMGHLTESSQNYLFPRGLTFYLSNQTLLSDDYLAELKSIFQISQDKRFQIYLQQENILVVSDPNDRFCTEHIQYYLKYFFPCKNFASLSLEKFINPSKLFQKYFAFEFKWFAETQQVYMKVIFPKQRQVLQISKQTNCGKISVHEINMESNMLSISPYINNVHYNGQMINRWYHPKKCISHSFKIQQIHNNSKIKMITMLPLGFILDNITINPLNTHFTYNITKIGKSLFLIFRILILFEQDKQIRIHINFHSSVPPFQNFQTIAAGGEEIMNVPLYFEGENMFHLHSKIISQRLLQPDFSIPFQTITFTVGIVGYLWINLWRIHKFKFDKINQE